MSIIIEPLENKRLDQLAERIRAAHKGVEAAFSNALESALAAGIAIIEARNCGASMEWICENCDLRKSTAYLYRRLAEHRAEIEIAREGNSDFSLRDARRLITKKKAPAGTTEETPATADTEDTALDDPFPNNDAERAAIVEARWAADVELTAIADAAAQWTDAVWERVFGKLKFERFLRVAPAKLLAQLERHYFLERAKQALPKHPRGKHPKLTSVPNTGGALTTTH